MHYENDLPGTTVRSAGIEDDVMFNVRGVAIK